MKKVDFVNSSLDGIPEINLSGAVEFYDGSYIANRILDSGKKHIRLRINCFGGNILGGYEIIAAQNQFTQDGGIIETWGLGVTDSVAGWLLANGTKGYRKVMPYNTMLLHLPATKDGLNANDLPAWQVGDGSASTTGYSQTILRGNGTNALSVRFSNQSLLWSGDVNNTANSQFNCIINFQNYSHLCFP